MHGESKDANEPLTHFSHIYILICAASSTLNIVLFESLQTQVFTAEVMGAKRELQRGLRKEDSGIVTTGLYIVYLLGVAPS